MPKGTIDVALFIRAVEDFGMDPWLQMTELCPPQMDKHDKCQTKMYLTAWFYGKKNQKLRKQKNSLVAPIF